MKHDIDSIRSEYDRRVKKMHFLMEEVRFSLYQAITAKKIKIHSLVHRVKKFDSFLDKIRRKSIQEPFNDIYDLIGLRVICLFLQDIDIIAEIIKEKFDVFEIDNKIDGVNEDVFGYMSLHYNARLKKPVTISGFEEISIYPFEIQVRTIAQDAWASISHYLDYKQESFLPAHLRRDFHALSGLFYVADTHFNFLRREQSKFFVETSFSKENDGTTSD